ncbi:MAG: TonB-dependent receptor [Mucilaginibacter sp.]|nr:TonB-dependent receptor [Mucilaginibacter sp.]
MRSLFLTISILLLSFGLHAQTLSGHVSDEDNLPVAGASVRLMGSNLQTACDASGNFSFKLNAGKYRVEISAIGFSLYSVDIDLSADKQLNIKLKPSQQVLKDVEVKGDKERRLSTHLKAVEGTSINAGKKNEVVMLDSETVNKATNNARQIYSKVAGLNIWESDGAGLQLGIGGRGLNPNRVINFNTRQNGYDISADALGYPESYYTPPAELVDRIEILRGASSLQYGTQFGGLINFKLREGNPTKPFEFTSRETAGSWNFLNTTNSVGGKTARCSTTPFISINRAMAGGQTVISMQIQLMHR